MPPTCISKKNNGSILLLATFIVPIILVLLVITVYLGQTLLLLNQMQNAADAGALAAAKKLEALGTDTAGATTEAIFIASKNATENKFTISSINVTFTPSVATPNYVKVSIDAAIAPLFNYGNTVTNVTRTRSAKARVGTKLPCLINLSSASNGQLTANGSSAAINLQTCTVASNSGIKVSAGRLSTAAIYLYTAQTVVATGQGKVCDSKNIDPLQCTPITPSTYGTLMTEPTGLLNLPLPTPAPPYKRTGTLSANNQTVVLTPGQYSNFKVTGTGNTVQFTPSSTTPYTFNGGLSISSGNKIEMLGGPKTWAQVQALGDTAGVFIYIPDGTLSMNANTVQLLASTVGSYKGALIKQNVTDNNTATINLTSVAGTTSYLRGDLDFPNTGATLTLTGGSSSDAYLGIIVAGTIKVTGNSHLNLTNAYSSASANTKITALVE